MIRRMVGVASQDEMFRRRQAVVSRRKESRFLQLLKPFVSAVVAVGIPTFFGAWMLTSSTFCIVDIDVSGNNRVEKLWLTEALESVHGAQIFWLSLREVETKLSKHRWIASAEARKELPNRLIVTIREESAVALLRQGSSVSYVGSDGKVIDDFDPELGSSDLLLISSPNSTTPDIARALQVALRLDAVQPEWASRLSEIEILNEWDYRLFTGALPFPILVSLETMESGIVSAQRYIPEIAKRYRVVTGIDVRFSNQIVIQPAAIGRT